MSENTQRYVRFLVSDRVLHLLLLVSFSSLAVTGLVQKYADAGISVTLIRAMGGIEQTRVFHHTFAVILILTSIAHAVQVGYRVYVQRKSMSMLPTLRDVTDFIAAIKYNAGLSKQKPHFPRFNFMEKVEYWAVVWGTVLMTITGYVLWNPVLITQYLPGEVVPAAKIAHGLEAVLAVLSIITWHAYFVHVKVFNKSMFTGHLTEHEMEEEHPLELERIRRGRIWHPPAPAVRYRRLKLYAPLATLFVLVSVLGTWRWLTAETTAITTVPRAAVEQQAYQPVLPTPRAVRLEVTPLPTPLRVLNVIPSATDSAPAAATPAAAPSGPGPIPHPVDGQYTQCLVCHATDSAVRPAPANHADFTVDQCTACHVSGEAPPPSTDSAPAAAPPAAAPSGPGPIPHPVDGQYTQCLACHATDSAVRPAPANHVDFTVEQCSACHTAGEAPPPSAESTPAPSAMPVIPHTIAGDWAQCSLCHAIDGGMRPMPAGHASFDATQCLTCHQTEGGDQ
jgi:formate dehydrogenase gamma subunit